MPVFQVVVNVINDLGTEVLTIHFHGMHHTCNTWMDGAAFISQCPVHPSTSFTYRFIASPAGSHWYHGHIAYQRMDGLFGNLIVHSAEPTHTYYPVNVMDWWHPTAEVIRTDDSDRSNGGPGEYMQFLPLRRTGTDNVFVSRINHFSTLVNGRGRTTSKPKPFPYEVFDVKKGEATRFHLVHSGAEHPYEVSIDRHALTIVGLEAGPIKPLTVDSFIIVPGQSVEFELTPVKNQGHYWMRFVSLGESDGFFTSPDGIIHEGRAIIKYTNTEGVKNPKSKPRKCKADHHCLVFNCPLQSFPDHLNKRCIHLNSAESALAQQYLDERYGLNCDPDEEYFLHFDFVGLSSINARTFVTPSVPFSQDNDDDIVPCDDDECSTGCRCTNILKLPKGKVIQMVLSNLLPINHPIHLHGHSFAVLKQGFGTIDNTTGRSISVNSDYKCNDENCYSTSWNGDSPEMKTSFPPIRNTVGVPGGGYSVIRFRSDNLGYWFLHCHFPFHLDLGMALVMQVGEKEDITPPPNGFPTCGNFAFEDDLEEYINAGSCKDPTGQCEI